MQRITLPSEGSPHHFTGLALIKTLKTSSRVTATANRTTCFPIGANGEQIHTREAISTSCSGLCNIWWQQFLILVDCKTDWPEILEIRNDTPTAKLTMTLSFAELQFQIYCGLMEARRVAHVTSSPHYSQSNGKAKATVRTSSPLHVCQLGSTCMCTPPMQEHTLSEGRSFTCPKAVCPFSSRHPPYSSLIIPT